MSWMAALLAVGGRILQTFRTSFVQPEQILKEQYLKTNTVPKKVHYWEHARLPKPAANQTVLQRTKEKENEPRKRRNSTCAVKNLVQPCSTMFPVEHKDQLDFLWSDCDQPLGDWTQDDQQNLRSSKRTQPPFEEWAVWESYLHHSRVELFLPCLKEVGVGVASITSLFMIAPATCMLKTSCQTYQRCFRQSIYCTSW